MLDSKCGNQMEGPPKQRLFTMFTALVIGIFGSMIGLIAFELIQEVYGSKHELHDHYHE